MLHKESEARRAYKRAYYAAHPDTARKYFRSPPGLARKMLATAKESSRRRGHPPPDITADDLIPLLEAGVCQVSGLRFVFQGEKGRQHPLSPSLDRPDASKPYTKDNFRVVCWAVNAGCGAWGLDEAKRVWAAVLAREHKPQSHHYFTGSS